MTVIANKLVAIVAVLLNHVMWPTSAVSNDSTAVKPVFRLNSNGFNINLPLLHFNTTTHDMPENNTRLTSINGSINIFNLAKINILLRLMRVPKDEILLLELRDALLDKNFELAIQKGNDISNNQKLVNLIMNLYKETQNTDEILYFASRLSLINRRLSIIKAVYEEMVNLKTDNVCNLLKLVDKIGNCVNNVVDNTTDIYNISTTFVDEVLKIEMLIKVTEINIKHYGKDINVATEDFPFYTVIKNNVQWYNILYWLEELDKIYLMCHHAIGRLSITSPVDPPIA